MKKSSQKSVYPRTRGGLWILIVAAVVLEATACVQYFYSRAGIRTEAEQRARTELKKAELEVEVVTSRLEASVKIMARMAEQQLHNPQMMYDIPRELMNTFDFVEGACVAFVPNYYPEQGYWFEVYANRLPNNEIHTRQIGSAAHDYFQSEWFHNGLTIDSCFWCEPYLDDTGAETMVVSCSYPIRDSKGTVVGVALVDLSLNSLKHLSDYLQIYQGSYYSITSAGGLDIVAKPDTVAGRKYAVFDQEIDATGWKISIIIPDDVIYAGLRKVGLIVTLMMLIGLVLLVFIMYRTGRSIVKLVNLSNQQERIEGELNIARSIQMAMLPMRFPPFPDYPNLNAFGKVIPAKEVGGDLFDFHIRDNKLYFCVGDVSGKGVPASLVMAVTRSLFRSFTAYIDNPASVMWQMNESLSGEANTRNMFVTFFLGVLDLATGELLYCNAGHDAPVVVRDGKPESLPVVPNLPLGVLSGFTYDGQSAQLQVGDAVFLYTDGLTEAENSERHLFGIERMMQTIKQWSKQMDAAQMVENMQIQVSDFVGEAPQSDDLTMLVVRYLGKSGESVQEKALAECHSLVMRNDIQQIPTLAEWIDTLKLPADLNMPVNLALEEVVSNVMLYAYPENKSGKVLVEAKKLPKQVIFTITDNGKPFDPTLQAEPDITLPAEQREIGGLGIFLVRQIMDTISYQRIDNKNMLTLTKNINV